MPHIPIHIHHTDSQIHMKRQTKKEKKNQRKLKQKKMYYFKIVLRSGKKVIWRKLNETSFIKVWIKPKKNNRIQYILAKMYHFTELKTFIKNIFTLHKLNKTHKQTKAVKTGLWFVPKFSDITFLISSQPVLIQNRSSATNSKMVFRQVLAIVINQFNRPRELLLI